MPSVVLLIALSSTSIVTEVCGTENTGSADKAYTVSTYNFAPGPCEQGGEYCVLPFTVLIPKRPTPVTLLAILVTVAGILYKIKYSSF